MVKLNVKQSNDNKLEIEIDTDKTVLDLKELISSKNEIPANEQRLIYSGKVLKDGDQLSVYKMADGHTLHLVRGKQPSQAQPQQPQQQAQPVSQQQQQSPFANPMNPMMGGGAGGNPAAAIQAMMSQNPQLLEQMITSNPMMAQMGMSPEAVRQMLQNPMFMQMLNDPNMMQQAMAMQQPGAGGASFMPGLQMPATQQPTSPQQAPELRYASQLEQMAQMGFTDAARNVRALAATGGNINAAIEYLFSMPQ